MIAPGNLLRVPFTFGPLRADSTTWEWLTVTPGHLLCLEEMDMTKEWTASGGRRAAGLAAAAAGRASAAAGAAGLWGAFAARAASAAQVGAEALAVQAVQAARARRVERREEYNKIYDLAREEYEKTGRIPGYKFLCPEGKNHIWLSHYDVEYLEKSVLHE